MTLRRKFHFCVLALFGSLATASVCLAGSADSALTELKMQADKGDMNAQQKLGDMFAKGDGAEHNYVQAHKWYNVATALGHKEARASRSILSQLMTPEQLAEAQDLARQWFARQMNGEK